MSQLRPCAACARHVRAAETRCPFCDAALDALDVATIKRPVPRAGLGRAALLAVGAAAAATTSIAACAGGSGPVPYTDGGSSSDAASAEGGADTSVPDTGAIAMPYGAPPADGLLEVV